MAKIPINIKSGTIQKNDVIVGIDLGTTNSLVAYIDGEENKVVKDEAGSSALMPSIIHFDNNNNIIVGEAAKSKLIEAPERTIYSVKRLLGKAFNDVKSFHSEYGYTIIDDDPESLVKIKVGNQYFNPVQLSAEILKALKERIESQLNKLVTKAVITVPAYFNDAQRQATRDAGKLAGLEVLRIVNEPTAASLAYGLNNHSDGAQTIAVYDLGGGTFDVSILTIEDGIFEVLATHGDTFLGGDDIDKLIINHWLEKSDLTQIHLNKDKTLGQTLRLSAEKAKIALSHKDSFSIEIGDRIFSLNLDEFNLLIEPLIDRTISSAGLALKDAGLSISDIDHVVMVGGSTRVPLVQKMVGDFFNQKPNIKINPDEVVALGAAIQANILAGKEKDILLLDVTPLSLGIETVGGLMDVIIPRNSKVPIRAGRKYTTSVDGQKNLKIAVYQGERDLIEHNRKLGEFVLSNIPPMSAGLPKIEIYFILDADGILLVKAKEHRSGIQQTLQIKSQYGISEEEMALMLLDSIQNAKVDMDLKSLVEARNEADYILLASKKFIEQNSDWLDAEVKKEILQLAENVASKKSSEQKDEIQAAIEALNNFTSPLAHQALDRSISGALEGKDIK